MQRIISSGFFDPNWYIETYRDVPPKFYGAFGTLREAWCVRGAISGPRFNSLGIFSKILTFQSDASTRYYIFWITGPPKGEGRLHHLGSLRRRA